MAFCCCACIDDGPIEGDKYNDSADKPNAFKVSMADAPCYSPSCCCLSCVCAPCALYTVRKRALGGSLEQNTCCLGYYPNCLCFRPGQMGERSCPGFCLAIEACLCCGCSISATRMHVMDMYKLHSDPCDRRIIRMNNCIQLFSCVFVIVSIFVPPLRQAAENTSRAAELVYLATQGTWPRQVAAPGKGLRVVGACCAVREVSNCEGVVVVLGAVSSNYFSRASVCHFPSVHGHSGECGAGRASRGRWR